MVALKLEDIKAIVSRAVEGYYHRARDLVAKREQETLALDKEIRELKFQRGMFMHELQRLAQFVLFASDLDDCKQAAAQTLKWLARRTQEELQ